MPSYESGAQMFHPDRSATSAQPLPHRRGPLTTVRRQGCAQGTSPTVSHVWQGNEAALGAEKCPKRIPAARPPPLCVPAPRPEPCWRRAAAMSACPTRCPRRQGPQLHRLRESSAPSAAERGDVPPARWLVRRTWHHGRWTLLPPKSCSSGPWLLWLVGKRIVRIFDCLQQVRPRRRGSIHRITISFVLSRRGPASARTMYKPLATGVPWASRPSHDSR